MARVLITSLGVGPGYADKEELRKREYKSGIMCFKTVRSYTPHLLLQMP